MRILAVDPGSKRLGLAISDTTGSIANPLTVLSHVSRQVDAAAVGQLAKENGVELIVMGQSLDEDGLPNLEGRRAAHLAEAIREQSGLPVAFWDEAFTTREARLARIAMGARRKQRSGHLDSLAATILLQSYLEANPQK